MEHGSFYHVLTYRFSWRYGTLYFNLDTLTQFLECRERGFSRVLYPLKYKWLCGTGVAQVVWIRALRTTCCSQFDSNAKSEAQASEVSTFRFVCRARIFEIWKSRKMVSV